MKKVKVNGNFIEFEKEKNLFDFLTEKNFDIGLIVVERNGEIVPKDNYKDVLLHDEDVLEVVTFVGGG
ncbi:MAG TPA: sulfur carrier protein ThiS [Bacillus bacterium]|nr:sulfur carrier protein ThiS [Bacillus sp. (in: firmicutes)]